MRVLFVSHSLVLKEYQQKLLWLVRSFNVEVFLLTPPYWYESGVKTPAYHGYGGIKYLIGDVVFLKKFVHFYKNPSSYIARINPDIVHVDEEPFSLPGYQFVKAAKKAGKKAVFFTSDNIRRKHNFIRKYFDSYCVKNADGVYAVNRTAKELLTERGCDPKKIHIIEHGVEPSDFEPKKFKWPKEVFRLLYFGRIAPGKGIETLLEALKKTKNTKLYLVGAGEKSYLKKIRKCAEKSGVTGRIYFQGYVKREGIPAVLDVADIAVVPSRTGGKWKEKFGRVIIEAFAARVPVIGSSSGEIPNVIGGAGMIFPEGNADKLAEKINILVKNPDAYRDCMEKGYKRMLENYSNEKIAEKMASLYRQVAGD